MKHYLTLFLTFYLFFMVLNVAAQPHTYQFKYINPDGKVIGVLTVNNKAFRFDSFQSIIKTQKSKTVYEFVQVSKSKCMAIRSSVDRFLGNEIFGYKVDQASGDTIVKIDTTYYKIDSIIAGLRCNKVGLNYVRNTIYDEKLQNIKYRDTVKIVFWVSTILMPDGFFTFRSKNLTGLILRFEETQKRFNWQEPSYFYITASGCGKKNIPASIFELPVQCVVYTDQDKYEQKALGTLLKNIGLRSEQLSGKGN